MAEYSVIARPYARAIFELAQAGDQLAAWSDKLFFASQVMKDEGVIKLLHNPRLSEAKKFELLTSLFSDQLDDTLTNLLRLLLENHRLFALPAIYNIFEEYRSQAEKSLTAEIITAYPLDEAQTQQVAEKLGQKLGCNVQLSASVDETLIGGAIVRAGDMVIDGSLRGRLEKLSHAIAR